MDEDANRTMTGLNTLPETAIRLLTARPSMSAATRRKDRCQNGVTMVAD